MQLKSVSRPAGESARAVKRPPPIAERRLGAAPDQSVARTKTTMKRLVVGKSNRPLVRLGMETVIHNPDERTHIVETDEAPWRMVCALTIDGPAGTYLGTGWLVGPRTIVTAGHCVYDANEMGGWANKITISPGEDGDELPYGRLESTKFSTVDLCRKTRTPISTSRRSISPSRSAIGWGGFKWPR